MKKLLAVFAIGLMIVMTMPQADAAKRFGGGSSFGRQAPVPALSQKAPAANPAQNFNRQQANPAAGAAAAAKPALEGHAHGRGCCARYCRFGQRPRAR